MENQALIEALFLWITESPSINPLVIVDIVKQLQSIEALATLTEEEVNTLNISQKQKEKLLLKLKDFSFQEKHEVLQCIDAEIITIIDDSYPKELRMMSHPPAMLFCRGNTELLRAFRRIAMVGTRKASPYGRRLTRKFIEDIAAKHPAVLLTGTAYGIDKEVITSAMTNKIPCISFLASGIDCITPKQNRDILEKLVENGGCVVTEFPPGIPSYASNYPIRSRVIAALADYAIIVEAPLKSGALLVAKEMNSYAKEVFCPTAYYTDKTFWGNHAFINNREAIPALTYQDVLDELLVTRFRE